MALFQKSVLNKFSKSQNTAKIETAYQQFSSIFLNAKRQAEIRSMKEEEYQDGFLDDLFVNILGYIKRPNAGYNLVREKKNEADSKKADGAILKNDSPLAVIELKGTDTKDLDKVTNQGFGYKNNHKECVYVVISNFEKLRFYIHHAVDYIEFNLFTLSKDEFVVLWLCLQSENLLDNIPAKIKAESVVKEEDITKNLYKDYSDFKQELWQSIKKLNPEGDPLMYYKKTQKLIDRFLFIFFAEDAGLLPPNSISRMVDRWKMLKEEDAYKPLYEIFKQYFGYINTGRPGKTPQDEIFAYNGGLMSDDDVLETITISDDVLLKHVSKLTSYDFSSEVDVNILGHIFENSLNDIEAVTAKLEGIEIDKSKTKRKKDGVFYTPKYITQYIVNNTVGKLCDEKKNELNIIDEEYAKGRANRKKETLKQLDANLQAYRNWLLNITICDPACGSGAFLNQALEYLMKEHRHIDELESQLLGAGFKFPGVENHILENNIFGVDINEESIEIAKLSLWLRTAQRGRKLTSLNNNIKCGNSLIDDPAVAGDKAFNWKKEFPDVFNKGGFDVIIGNPPYVSYQSNSITTEDLKYFNKIYQSSHKIFDLYGLFIEKSFSLLNNKSQISFITPNLFLMNDSFAKLRSFISKNFTINQIVNCEDGIFEDAVVPTAIFVFEKGIRIPTNVDVFTIENKEILQASSFEYNFFVRNPEEGFNIKLDKVAFILINKFEIDSTKLGKILHIRETIKTGNDKEFISEVKYSEDYYPMVTGKEVSKYRIFSNKFLYFNEAKLSRPTKLEYYKMPKLFIRRVGKNVEAAYDDKFLLSTHVLYIGTLSDHNFNLKYILALLNSPFFTKIYHLKFPPKGSVFPEIRIGNLRELPIKKLNSNRQNEYESLVDEIIKNQELIEKRRSSFSNYILSKYEELSSSNKILNWNNYSYNDLLKEFKKNNIELGPSSEIKLLELFQEYNHEITNCQINNESLKTKIDQMIIVDYEIDSKELIILNA